MLKNILALQIPSTAAEPKKNFDALEEHLCKIFQNSEICPDFLFLPEVWSVGWYPKCFNDCIDNGETVKFLAKIAKTYNVNVFGGSFIRQTDDGLKNSMPVILKDGSLLGYYDKIHLYTPDGEGVLNPGISPVLFEIEGLKTGVSICYDIRFPELFRSYSLSDNPPHLLVNLSAWPMTRALQYSQMAASRAIENQCYFLALSQCGEIIEGGGIYNSGGSCVYDSMGNLISKLDKNFGYIYFTLDTEGVDKTRLNYPNLKNAKVRDFGFNVKTIFAEGVKC